MKALLAGAAVAAAAGLMMGSAMHPDLITGDDRPQAPAFGEVAGQTSPIAPSASLASYGANAPDYVIGTDAKKAMAGPDLQPVSIETPAPEADSPYIIPNDPPLPPPAHPAASRTLTRAAYAEPAPETVTYPSVDGGQPYAADVATGDDTTTLPLTEPPTG